MATINQADDQNNPQQPNLPPTTGGAGASGSGTGKGVGAAPAAGVQQNQNPQQGQGYTDVASYLNANQGGGSQLGNQVASNLTNQYNATKQGIDTSAANTNQQVNQGYIPENTQLIQQVAANPTAAASDQGQLSQFQGQLNDTYGGPSNWADFGTQQGNVNQAVQNANLVNTPGGNNALIQQVENQSEPGHTSQGINQLDTLLYQGNPNAVASAQAAAKPYDTLNDYINSQNTAIGSNITNAQNTAAQTSQDALNAFTGQNGTLTNLNNTINNTTAADLSQAQGQQAAVKTALANLYGGVAQNNTPSSLAGYGGSQTPWYNTQNYTVGNISGPELSALGMSQDQWKDLWSSLQNAGTTTNVSSNIAGPHNFGALKPTSELDLSQFLNQQDPTQSITNSTTATPEQYQQMAAIQQLLGSKTPQGTAINPLNAAQAGTYNPANNNSFNYQNALNAAQQLGTQEQETAQNAANGVENAATAGHAASQHQGGFLNGLKQDITHPGNLIGSAINPLSWASNAQNIVKGNPVQPGAINPLSPTKAITVSHGGEIEEDGTVASYLNKRK